MSSELSVDVEQIQIWPPPNQLLFIWDLKRIEMILNMTERS